MYIAIFTFTDILAASKEGESSLTEMCKISLWFPTVLGTREYDIKNFAAKIYKSLLAHKYSMRERHG